MVQSTNSWGVTRRGRSVVPNEANGRIRKNVLVDWAVGLGRRNKGFDVSLVVTNLFDDDTPRSQTWNSYTPAIPRTVSVVFTGRL